MRNVRPKQLHTPTWPWKNKIINGLPTVVESEPFPWMPELVSCYDWSTFEYQETPYPGDGLGTRDMKSIFTTAVRMYGYERLYLEIMGGNNVFGFIGAEMRRWTRRMFEAADKQNIHIRWLVIGDDIAHNGGLFMPPGSLMWLYDEYVRMADLARLFGASTIYHSDGNITEAWRGLEQMAAGAYLFQKELVDIEDPRIMEHESELEWSSYPVREMDERAD